MTDTELKRRKAICDVAGIDDAATRLMSLEPEQKDEWLWDGHAQTDCPINQTECDENCVYYNKLLLKCPLKVEGNGGK